MKKGNMEAWIIWVGKRHINDVLFSYDEARRIRNKYYCNNQPTPKIHRIIIHRVAFRR